MKADRRRAFGAWFWAASLLWFLTLCSDVFFDLLDPSSNAMMTFLFCGAVTPVYAVSAILAALPFATGFLRDWNSGLAVSMQLRCGRKRFLISKALCSVLSGGLALGIGSALFILLINFRLTHEYESVAQIISEASFYDIQMNFTPQSLILYYASMTALECLAGMFYASIALAVSAFIPNTAITLCSVIVIYRVLKEIAFLLPSEWMVPVWLQIGSVSLDMGHTLLAALGVLGGGTLICCIIFGLRASRRLRYS